VSAGGGGRWAAPVRARRASRARLAAPAASERTTSHVCGNASTPSVDSGQSQPAGRKSWNPPVSWDAIVRPSGEKLHRLYQGGVAIGMKASGQAFVTP
jgi:hypothetical protein